ncbi:MAG: lactate dehydrogenase-like 2-hydroxyacid dehydrogenase [Clostridium sp.]|jgi:lactate dehydrogenase-like 2-hydroxyacid dehydrogenase
MKMVVLHGFTMNPGDLSWEGLTTHIAWAPKEPRERLMNTAIDNLVQFINKVSVNVV